jgi:choline-sulfatase
MKESIASHDGPNVVLFMADSYVPQFMGIHGDKAGGTPNIDRIASRGVVFENAYCNSPLCAPSRASFLTGASYRK